MGHFVTKFEFVEVTRFFATQKVNCYYIWEKNEVSAH